MFTNALSISVIFTIADDQLYNCYCLKIRNQIECRNKMFTHSNFRRIGSAGNGHKFRNIVNGHRFYITEPLSHAFLTHVEIGMAKGTGDNKCICTICNSIF